MKIFYFIVTLTIGFSVFSQNEIKEIQILNSDKTFFNEKKHPDYWRLIGNVSFKHNNTIMKCDSAYHFRKDQNMIAFGNIKIVQADSLFISGKKLNYIGKEDKIEINENVIMKNKYIILKTNQLEYNIKNKIGKYNKSGIIIDSDKIIKSKNGIYNNKNNLIKFIDSVEIIGNDYKIISNNMHYYSQLKQAYFYGPTNLFFQKDTIFTEKGWYNTKNKQCTSLWDGIVFFQDALLFCFFWFGKLLDL